MCWMSFATTSQNVSTNASVPRSTRRMPRGARRKKQPAPSRYHVTERGQEWYFKTSPGEELLDAAEKLRGYVTAEKGTVPDLFIKNVCGRPPHHSAGVQRAHCPSHGEHRQGARRVRCELRQAGVLRRSHHGRLADLGDAGCVSGGVPSTRSQFASSDDKWRKLLDHLSGKEITSAGHLLRAEFLFR
mgnify:CR=1 FL=1